MYRLWCMTQDPVQRSPRWLTGQWTRYRSRYSHFSSLMVFSQAFCTSAAACVSLKPAYRQAASQCTWSKKEPECKHLA